MAYVFNGSGTASDPFIIDSCEAWVEFVSDRTSIQYIATGSSSTITKTLATSDAFYWKMTSDIDFNDYSGTYPNKVMTDVNLYGAANNTCLPRIKELDGGGFTLKNVRTTDTLLPMYVNSGTATIKNFNCQNIIIGGVTSHIALVSAAAASASAPAVLQIDNCNLSVMITASNECLSGNGTAGTHHKTVESLFLFAAPASSTNKMAYTNMTNSTLKVSAIGKRWPVLGSVCPGNANTSTLSYHNNHGPNFYATDSIIMIKKNIILTPSFPEGLHLDQQNGDASDAGYTSASYPEITASKNNYLRWMIYSAENCDITLDINYIGNNLAPAETDRDKCIPIPICQITSGNQIKITTDFSNFTNKRIILICDYTMNTSSIVDISGVNFGTNIQDVRSVSNGSFIQTQLASDLADDASDVGFVSTTES